VHCVGSGTYPATSSWRRSFYSNFGYEPHVKMAKRDIQVKVDLKEDLNGFVSLKQMDERL